MPNFVGFLRGAKDSMSQLSPDEAQRTLERYLAWSEELAAAGNSPSGGGLTDLARVIRRNGTGLAATDGPFAESEIVGGYISVEAGDLDEAEKIFSSHPHLEFGSIEIRKLGTRGCAD
jgi:hypothetical protein